MRKFFEKFKNRNQPNTAKIEPTGDTFEVPKNHTLLQAAKEQGLNFPHHCTVGACGTCRCKLLEGHVSPILDFSYTLTEAEISDGYILACQTLLKEDVVIELDFNDQIPTHPIENFTGKIIATKMLTHDIMEVSVELDRPISYTAGQFADIKIERFGRHRSYSFANAPKTSGTSQLNFHVRKISGGSYTEWLFEQDRNGETFELHGPNGAFWLRPGDTPLLFIAGGSGMAPIKAILEDALIQEVNRPVVYLFGAKTQHDLYCLEEMQTLNDKWPNSFKFIPILSEEAKESDWSGKRGLVTDFLNTEITKFDLKDAQTYLCGPPGMIDAALLKLEKANVSIEQIHYDKFLDSRQLEVQI